MKKLLKTLLASLLVFGTITIVNATTENIPYETDYLTKLSKSKWSAVADSYQNKSGDNDGPASNLLDNNYASIWHSAYNSSAITPGDQIFDHNIKFKFSDDFEPITFGAFSYTTRNPQVTNGNIAQYEIYISDATTELTFDSSEWGSPIQTGTFMSAGTTKVIFDQEYTATQLKFVAKSAQNGGNFASGAEFDLYRLGRKSIDPTNFTLSVSGAGETRTNPVATSGDKPTKSDSDSLKQILFDSSLQSYWQSTPQSPMTEDNSFLKIDLGNTYVINRIDLSKRYDYSAKLDCTGNMNNAIIQTSLDGASWTTVYNGVLENVTDKLSSGTFKISFEEITAKYIRISSNDTYHWKAAEEDKIMCLSDVKVYGETTVESNLSTKQGTSFNVYNPDGTPGEYDKKSRPLSNLYDGNLSSGNYVDIHGSGANPKDAYLQADLGELCMINSIKMYRYSGNTYANTLILVSETKDFSNPTVVYNSDTGNHFGFGEGKDVPEQETNDGKVYNKNLPAKGRYVRVYASGKADGTSNDNHMVELKIMGSTFVEPTTKYLTTSGNGIFSGYVRESKYVDDLGLLLFTGNVSVLDEIPYTKYVPKRVLSVKAQTNTDGEVINARFVSSVPSINLEELKFKITVGERTREFDSITKVYKTIYSDFGHQVNEPNVVFENDASKYFFAVKLNKIPATFDGTITVTPCWRPIGEDEFVEGMSRTFVVNEGTLVDAK